MNKPYKETAVAVVSKEQLIFLKHDRQDNGYTDFLVKQLSSQLAERIIQVLLHEREIVASLSDLRVEEYMSTNSVEYRRNIEWSPLVRCKDCKNHELCSIEEAELNDETFFCKRGERREDGKT